MKRQKVQSDLLNNLYLASPCKISWDSMAGDDRKRACGGCARNVYNLSSMSKKEAELFLEANGTNHCMIFYRRADGTVMTDECPVALRKIRDRLRMLTRVAASLLAFVVSLPAAFGQSANSNSDSTNSNQRKPIRQIMPFPGQPAVYANPAGGVILHVPQQTVRVEKVVTPRLITVTEVDITKKKPIKTEVTQPDGKKVLHEKKEQAPNTTPNKNLDTKAFDYFTKAKDAKANGKNALAEFFLEKAIESFDEQHGGDRQFRNLLETELKQLR